MKNKIRLTAVLIVFAILLSGCELGDAVQNALEMRNSPPGAAWINSEIEGAIDENTKTNEKDDFFTAVNKDWILNQTLDDSGMSVQIFESVKTVERRKIELLKETAPAPEDTEKLGLSSDEIEHAREIVSLFAAAAGNTEKRNELGAEPLRPYIEAISGIQTLEEMNDYIADKGGMNIVGQPLISFRTAATPDSKENIVLNAEPVAPQRLALKDTGSYLNMNDAGIQNKEVFSEIITLVLNKLGWSAGEIRTVLRRSYNFEYKLAKRGSTPDEYYNREGYDEDHSVMTAAQLQEISGDYPVEEILKLWGYSGETELTVTHEEYMKALGRIYSKANLEEIKAFYITHTVMSCADLLDIPTKEAVYATLERSVVKEEKGDEAGDPTGTASMSEGEKLSPEDEALKKVAEEYVTQYLRAPFEMLYIASYCSPEQKAEVREIVHQLKDRMRSVISETEWLTETGKAGALEKLASMEERILYPDEFISYLGLDIHEGQSLVDMVHNISAFENMRFASGAGERYDRSRWDLAVMPTTDTNAYNDITANTIAVLAGIIADGFTFDPEYPDEVNLARLGTIVGHEITHGFDSIGYGYDKFGFKNFPDESEGVITYEDESVFTKKVFQLSVWYAALTPVPGLGTYPASVSSEAIADMGGMKTVLAVAAEDPDFDYDLFFRSYAEVWRKVNTFDVEKMFATGDEHPLAFLRTNITLQQFDQFFETYGIKEGDGMYLPAEKRILVW